MVGGMDLTQVVYHKPPCFVEFICRYFPGVRHTWEAVVLFRLGCRGGL